MKSCTRARGGGQEDSKTTGLVQKPRGADRLHEKAAQHHCTSYPALLLSHATSTSFNLEEDPAMKSA